MAMGEPYKGPAPRPAASHPPPFAGSAKARENLSLSTCATFPKAATDGLESLRARSLSRLRVGRQAPERPATAPALCTAGSQQQWRGGPASLGESGDDWLPGAVTQEGGVAKRASRPGGELGGRGGGVARTGRGVASRTGRAQPRGEFAALEASLQVRLACGERSGERARSRSPR